MMTILPMPHSFKLHPKISVSRASLVTADRNLTHVATTPYTNSTYQTKNLLQLTNPCAFDRYWDSVSEANNHKNGFSNTKPKRVFDMGITHQTAEEGLMEELGVLVQRLERVVNRIRDLEMEKLMSKTKEELSFVEKEQVENMSSEIVSKFLEKPIQYLKSKDGKLEDKLGDLNVLVVMLERSCLIEGKHKSS